LSLPVSQGNESGILLQTNDLDQQFIALVLRTGVWTNSKNTPYLGGALAQP